MQRRGSGMHMSRGSGFSRHLSTYDCSCGDSGGGERALFQLHYMRCMYYVRYMRYMRYIRYRKRTAWKRERDP